ncbi:MAG: phosphotransferase family protein [Gaiellaceae bacterium]
MKPEAVAAAERILGSAATTWTRVTSGGWSINEHWIVALADGRRAFLKRSAPMEPCPTWLRAERSAYAAFEGSFVPRVLGWQDGPRPLLVLEDLSPGAHWPPPWRAGDVDAVLTALREVAAAQVFAELPRLADDAIGGWPAVAWDPEPFLRLGLVSRAWLDAALPRLVDAWAATPLDGEALLHCDIRSDNLCLRDGRAVIFDWSDARIGNPDFDVAFWLPSLAAEGGPRPDEILPGAGTLTAVVSGYFAAVAGLPPPAF